MKIIRELENLKLVIVEIEVNLGQEKITTKGRSKVKVSLENL